MVAPTKFTVLLCEDIRQEVGNKFTVLGLFAGNVIEFPPEAPVLVQLNLTIVILVHDGEGTFSGTFQLTGPAGLVGTAVQIPSQTKVQDATMVLIFAFKPTPPIAFGEFRADLSLSGVTYSHAFQVRRLQRPN